MDENAETREDLKMPKDDSLASDIQKRLDSGDGCLVSGDGNN
jgi:hypothetical protein